LLAGAIPTALLAVLTDTVVGLMQKCVVSPGVRPGLRRARKGSLLQ
jgi:ABC-type proline/glycine betaine transport system permease subunit